MSPIVWMLAGAAGWLVLSLVISAVVDREVREGLARTATAVVLVPAVLITIPLFSLPALRRRRVTVDTLRAAIDDNRFETRTTAVLWPGHALVFLRSRPRSTESEGRA